MVCDVSCLLRKSAHFHVIGDHHHHHHIACRILGLVVSSSLINSQEVFRELCNWTCCKNCIRIFVAYGCEVWFLEI